MPRSQEWSPISALQELTQKKCKALPQYSLGIARSISGTHSNCLNYRMTVNAFDVTASGTGTSKKEAKHNAATEILKKLVVMGLCDAMPDIKPEVTQEGSLFTCQCEIASTAYRGMGKSEEEAKESAARKMLNKINCAEEDIDRDSNEEDQEFAIEGSTKENENKFILTLKMKMKVKNVTFPDSWKQLEGRNEKELGRFLGSLGIEYKIGMCQALIPIASILFNDTSFSLVAAGSSEENAKLNLIGEVFTFLDTRLG